MKCTSWVSNASASSCRTRENPTLVVAMPAEIALLAHALHCQREPAATKGQKRLRQPKQRGNNYPPPLLVRCGLSLDSGLALKCVSGMNHWPSVQHSCTFCDPALSKPLGSAAISQTLKGIDSALLS